MFDWNKFYNEYGIEIEDLQTGETVQMSLRELLDLNLQGEMDLSEPARDAPVEEPKP
jgi:hypothetical protein